MNMSLADYYENMIRNPMYCSK